MGPLKKKKQNDFEEEELSDDQVKKKRRKPQKHEEDDVPQFERLSQRDSKYNELHGTPQDNENLSQELSQYSQTDWDKLISDILGQQVDSDSDDVTLANYFQLFYKVFCSPLANEHAVFDRIKSLYPNSRTMKDQFHTIQERFGRLHVECINKGWVDIELASGREMSRKITLIAYCIRTSFDQLVLTRMLQHAHDPMTRSMLEELTPEAFFQELDMTKLKKHQQVLHFYLRKANRNNYRKDGDALYEPQFNKEGQFVHAYKYVYDISDFVFQGLFPLEQNQYWFNCLTEKPGTAKSVIDHLTKIRTEWLPDLKRNDMIHSFRNGLFSIEFNEFFYFKPTPGKLNIEQLMEKETNLTAIKFHDVDFDELGMTAEMKAQPELGFMAIELKEVKGLLEQQAFLPEEQKFILGMGGRLLFPLGKFDAWQVFPYFLGLASTGKSLFLRLISKCLEQRDVAILGNALQRTFALDGVEKCKLYLMLDIDEHFQLDQATFQSMVSAEEVAVTRKNRTPLTLVWKIPGASAGNKLPHWTDNSGSLTRRIIVIEFLKRVKNSDPQLFEKCLLRMDRFLKLITSAYHELVLKHRHCNIKDVMPAKFRNSEKKALVELNTLAQFLSDNCEIEEYTEGVEFKTSIVKTDLVKVFKDYCYKQSIKVQPFSYTYYNGVFSKNCIKESKNENGVVFHGLDLKPHTKAWLETQKTSH
jgi:hypothetical protein